MVPERKLVDPQLQAVQEQRYSDAKQNFGQAFARGQNMFSVGTDLVRRLVGRQSLSQEMTQATDRLEEERFSVVEVRARRAAQGAANDALYRQALAVSFAEQHLQTGEEITITAIGENRNLGVWDAVYQLYIAPEGTLARMALAAGAIYTAQGIQNPNEAAAVVGIGVFVGATAAMDGIRQVGLRLYDRSRAGAAFLTDTRLVRRISSIREGRITGDEIGNSQPLDNELQQRLAQTSLDRLELDGINRPDLTRLTDYTDILNQRASLRRTSKTEDLKELVRSRNLARVSRLTRTLIATVFALGLINTQLQRPEYCGTGAYRNPDTYIEQITGGVQGVSSWKGLAESVWFRRVAGLDFDPNNPKHREMFDYTFDLDPEGNKKDIQRIVDEYKRKNDGIIQSVTRDLFRHGEVRSICAGDIDPIFNRP